MDQLRRRMHDRVFEAWVEGERLELGEHMPNADVVRKRLGKRPLPVRLARGVASALYRMAFGKR